MSNVITTKRRIGRINVHRPESRSPFPDLRDVVLEELSLPDLLVPALRDLSGEPEELSQEAAYDVPVIPARDEEQIRRMLEEQYQRGLVDGAKIVEERIPGIIEERVAHDRASRQDDAIQRLDRLTTGFNQQLNQIHRKAEEAVVKLALSIASQIVKREVRLDNTIVIQQIREALQRIVGVEHIKIRVNPADEALIREHRSAIIAGSDAIREMAIEADAKIEPGGCIVESDSGNVDARLSTQLKKIESLFLDSTVVS